MFPMLLPSVLACYLVPGGMSVCASHPATLSQPATFRVDCTDNPNACRHMWCCPEEPVDGEVSGCAPAPACESGYWVRCPHVWTKGTCD
ncbi:hypothetical protein ACNOYE_13910 [Nannocystaceae bacterium ST9]